METPGRNNPCPCGSGKKYKYCCGVVRDNGPAVKRMSAGEVSLQGLLQTGMAHHQAGRLPEAEAVYRQILQTAPEHPEALYLSGLVAHESGRSEAAVALIEKAICTHPIGPFYFSLGNILHALGKPEEAVKSFRKALKLAPNMFEVHLNLGNILKAQRKMDKAAKSFRNALKFNPDYAEAYNNLGDTLREQGRLDEAIENFREALKRRPNLAGIHYNLGNALYEQGQMDEAIDSFGKALYLKPDYAEAWNGMGNALYNQGTIDGAIACFHKAIKSRPDLTEAYVRLGNMLREQGDLDGATENFHKALALNPDYASAYIGLGRIHQNTGQFADANACFDRAFALEPDNPSAWAEWAWLRKMTSDDRPWSETAQHLLKKSKRLLGEMRLCYALGKYHDDTHQYETSFGYYARANRLRQKITGPFDRDAFVRFVDEIISAYPLEPIRRATGASNSRQPVFVVGMPRSGSSLTEQILSSHPEVFGAGELSFWQTQVDAHSTAMPDWLSDSALLQKIASRCEAELRRHSATALRVVDKMPGNFMHLGLIHAVFPQARILHTQRNPVDTCLSVYFQNFNGHTYANDLDDLAFYYREYRRLMAHWRAVLPPEVFMDVPYEALVEDQEGWSRRIIEFIGLEWDERCLNFHETERKVGTASNWQVRQKIYKTSKERWRNYEQFVGPLLSLLEPAE